VLPVAHLRANPRNPRRHFDVRTTSPSSSPRSRAGVVQPILVRALTRARATRSSPASGAGARRSARGCTTAGRRARRDDREALEIAIVENVQRADLNPIDEALGYEQLIGRSSPTRQSRDLLR
jgi:ParB family chromosome partitioning protein